MGVWHLLMPGRALDCLDNKICGRDAAHFQTQSLKKDWQLDSLFLDHLAGPGPPCYEEAQVDPQGGPEEKERKVLQ